MSEMRCECDRGVVIAAAFRRPTSLLIRRIEDVGHERAARFLPAW